MAEDRSMIAPGDEHGALSKARLCPIPIPTFIYLATPYSDPEEHVRHQRYIKAKHYAGKLIAAGLPTFSPIVHCHSIAQVHELPTDADFWWNYNLRFLHPCSLIAVAHIDGWDSSVGVERELTWAGRNNKPYLLVDVSEDVPQFRELD